MYAIENLDWPVNDNIENFTKSWGYNIRWIGHFNNHNIVSSYKLKQNTLINSSNSYANKIAQHNLAQNEAESSFLRVSKHPEAGQNWQKDANAPWKSSISFNHCSFAGPTSSSPGFPRSCLRDSYQSHNNTRSVRVKTKGLPPNIFKGGWGAEMVFSIILALSDLERGIVNDFLKYDSRDTAPTKQKGQEYSCSK